MKTQHKLSDNDLKMLQTRIKLIVSIGFDLNMLAVDLPIEVTVLPNKKSFSDDWLKQNGFGHLVPQSGE